jgi:hypothetical protein
MKRCISVSFDFKGKQYYAIVRHRTIENKRFYKIRIMNHRLDTLLNRGNFSILEEQDGNVCFPGMDEQLPESKLRATIASELISQIKQEEGEKRYSFITDFKLLTPY